MGINNKFDLHIHSNYSDGLLTIIQIVELATKKGLDGIAITDHDNIESWEEIDSYNYKIPIIKGVEMSTVYKENVVHILGYYLNNGGNFLELENKLKIINQKRRERVLETINKLKAFNIDVTYEEIIKNVNGTVARPHIANAILHKYPERSYTFQSLFDEYLGDDKPAFVKIEDYDTSEAITLLHQNNCLAVLAHPWTINKFDFREILAMAIDGIECDVMNIIENSEIYLSFASANNLIITAGSDYHGPNFFEDIGNNYLFFPDSNKFLNKINYKKL